MQFTLGVIAVITAVLSIYFQYRACAGAVQANAPSKKPGHDSEGVR
jgi:hypothetical protein